MNIESLIERSLNMNPDVVSLAIPDVAIRVYLFEDGVLETRQCRLSTRTISNCFFFNHEEQAWCYRDMAKSAKK